MSMSQQVRIQERGKLLQEPKKKFAGSEEKPKNSQKCSVLRIHSKKSKQNAIKKAEIVNELELLNSRQAEISRLHFKRATEINNPPANIYTEFMELMEQLYLWIAIRKRKRALQKISEKQD